jgi:hypothetical protein
MLHAPVNETKSENGQAKRPLTPLPEREWYPLSVEASGHQSPVGNGSGLTQQPATAQYRGHVGSLQRMYGNQAVLQMRSGSRGQIPHLTPLRPSQSGLLQRKCACSGVAGSSGECAECQEKRGDILQRRAANQAEPGTVPPTVHEVLRSPGQPLDPDTRAFFEPRFGYDFSQVRVHTDAKAAESAGEVNALAYTVGKNVVFGAGQYAPHSSAAMQLVAHELTHVIQQMQLPAPSTHPLKIVHPDSAEEIHAKQVSDRILQNHYAGPITRSSLSLARQDMDADVEPQDAEPIAGVPESSPPPPTPTTPAPVLIRTVKIWIHSFIPMASISDPFGYCYRGDNRTFSNAIHASYRTHQEVEFDVSSGGKTIDWVDTGTTHEVDCKTGAVKKSAKAPTTGLVNGSISHTSGIFSVNFTADAKNPLAWYACAINLDLKLTADPAAGTCGISGQHDGFPAYEVYVAANGGAGVKVYTYDPTVFGEGPTALCGGMDKTASAVRNFL